MMDLAQRAEWLFGLGLVAGGVGVALTRNRELVSRWLVWLVAAPVVLAATAVPDGMTLLALALVVVAGAEYARLVSHPGAARTVLGLCCVAPVAAVALDARAAAVAPFALVVAALASPWLLTRLRGTRPIVVPAALGAGLVGLPLAALSVLPQRWVLPAMAAVSFGDVAGYLAGHRFGRRGWLGRPISPWSPNKTVAGLLGSLAVGTAVLSWFGTWWLIPLVPVAGVVGDLRESRLKRMAGVKDAGAWLPGFGGLLDRIDSVLGAIVGVAATYCAGGAALLSALVFAGGSVGAIMGLRTPPRPARRRTRLAAAAIRRAAWRTAFAASGGLTRHGRLPAGACVVVANHCSHADTPALLASLDAAHTPRVAAAADYWFTTPLRATFCRGAVAGFPVRRTGGGFADLCAAAEMLRHGGAVVVFPSGSRTATSGVCHAGAFRLAARYGVPVVPVGLAGTAQVLPKSGTLTRHRVSVRIGEPIPVPGDAGRDLDRAVRLAVDAMGRLAEATPGSGAQLRRRRRRAGRGSAPRDDSAKPAPRAEIAASR